MLTGQQIITIKAGREKSIRNGHPWIYQGAIQQLAKKSEASAGSLPPEQAIVQVVDHGGKFLGLGYCNPKSQIAVRLLSSTPATIDQQWFVEKIRAADHLRKDYRSDKSAYRVVFSDADFLPGLLLERYDDTLILQFLTLGMANLRPWIVGALAEIFPGLAIRERPDDQAMQWEGFTSIDRWILGEGKDDVIIKQGDLRFHVNFAAGQKTGFYLDQADNRPIVAALCKGARVFDGCTYAGGFAMAAIRGGAAAVRAVDSSQDALDLGARNQKLNDLDSAAIEWQRGDIFEVLRQEQPESYDVVILDPPKFAASASQVDRAARGYKDINRLGFKLLKPGGLLVSFSCSGYVTPELFQKIVFSAAVDAKCDAHIVKHLRQAADHPIRITFPESFYLKGLVCRKV